MMAALAAVAFSACEKENKEVQQHDPVADDDQTEITEYDGLEWLQGCLVVVDENNVIVRRVFGEPLDSSKPAVLSVPAHDLEMAENTFLGWVAPGKEVTEVDGGYDYNLTDSNGKTQGCVSFRAMEGEGDVLAKMTVADGTDLKQVSEVLFIDSGHWPENASIEKYDAGKTYQFPGQIYTWDFNDKMTVKSENLSFYCIQGNNDGKEAVLVWLCPDIKGYANLPRIHVQYDVYKNLPTVAEAQKVLAVHDNNYEEWEKMISYMDSLGYSWAPKSGLNSSGNMEFLLSSYDSTSDELKCMDLDKERGNICNVSRNSWYMYRYMHVRIFPPRK